MNDPVVVKEQVLRIHLDHVRRLSELPEEVTIIGIVPNQDQHHFMWFAGIPTPEKTLLLRIGSKWSIQHHPRSLLTIEDFDDFITRYHELEERHP